MTKTETPGSRFTLRADRHGALAVRLLGLVVAVMGTLILLGGVSG